MNSLRFTPLGVIGMAMVIASTSRGQIQGRDIVKLPPAKRLAVVRAAVVERKNRLENLEAVIVQESRPVKVGQGEVVLRRDPSVRQAYHVRKLGDSYRVGCTETNLRDGKEQFRWLSNYISETGIVRSFTTMAESGETYARIGHEQNAALEFNKFALFLSGKWDEGEMNRSLMDWILLDDASTVVEDKLGEASSIVVRITPKNWNSANQKYSMRVWLEPERGFSILRFEDRMTQAGNSRGKGPDVLRRGVVTEQKELDGVWVPTKIVFLTGHLHREVGGEEVITVDSIELGKVTTEDLAVDFPTDAEVDDQIQQKAYLEGKEAATVVSYAGKDSYVSPRSMERMAAAETGPRVTKSWMFWGNIAIVGSLILVLLLRHWRWPAVA